MEITHSFNFGDDKQLAEHLKQLVLSGKKTATTGLYTEDYKVPIEGEYAQIIDTNGKPFCVVQYTNVEVEDFIKVQFDYVLKEGEGDKNVEEWREKHRKFFSLKNDNVKVVCEEFKLIDRF